MTKPTTSLAQILTAGILFVAAASIPAGAAEVRPGPDAGEAVLHGEALARLNCARCHEVGIAGESPRPAAPPFWSLSDRRPVATIAQMLIEQASPEHTDMPTFEITQKQAEDIAAWISWVQPLAHGRRLVIENYASCHAVTLTDESRHPDAPPFRLISKRLPIEALEEAFAEGIESGHPDMPVFETDIIQLQDIISYIASIQTVD